MKFTWQIFIVTGATSMIVVTLSNTEETRAVKILIAMHKYHKLPPEYLKALTPAHSKKPVFEKIPTMIIIPKSNPIVSKSINPTT